MKIIRYKLGNDVSFGILEGDSVVRPIDGSPFSTLDTADRTVSLSDVQLLAPVVANRIFGAASNYYSSIREGGLDIPVAPILFMKPNTAVIGPDAPIVYPCEGKNVFYEGELAVVIGRQARRVSEADALDHVFGYTCGNDLTERVIQAAEMKQGSMVICKSFDTFNPLGPCIETQLSPNDAELIVRVNGVEKQRCSTSDMVFSVQKLIAHISAAITLLPGDVIMSGTPAGLGSINVGDVVEVEISGIGTLRNSVVDERKAA